MTDENSFRKRTINRYPTALNNVKSHVLTSDAGEVFVILRPIHAKVTLHIRNISIFAGAETVA